MSNSPDSLPSATAQPGIIEGFFGRSWSWQKRHQMADFLAGNGFDFYIYAPKNDTYLRRQWQSAWPAEVRHQLEALREYHRKLSLNFGIGLTPLDIYQASISQNRQHLRNKLAELNELSPDILCILFDDMRGDWPQLAEQQIRWVETIAELSNAKQFIFCPTYYSTDPVLEKVFGDMPENYWQDLGRGLDRRIEFFWTGPKVCSTDYPEESLLDITAAFGRKPFLWDNYPVNDGAVKAGFLHLDAVPAGHARLPELISGYCANPMNQPMLSRTALFSVPRAFRQQQQYNPEQTFIQSCQELYPADFATALMNDAEKFQQQGLKGLSDADKKALQRKYRQIAESWPEQGAEEICGWLNDEYVFDPACLTE